MDLATRKLREVNQAGVAGIFVITGWVVKIKQREMLRESSLEKNNHLFLERVRGLARC